MQQNAAADRRPQIDGLRTLAISGVLYAHLWWHETAAGHLGVRLFFVISGFLITGQLLQARSVIANGDRSFRAILTSFYKRRALRIFPAYYVLVFILAAFNIEGFRHFALWHASYLSNLLFIRAESYNEPWVAAHLWTLSIEAQFYLLWPIVILLAPVRWTRPLIVFCIVLALAYRAFGVLAGWGEQIRLLTPLGQLDALAAGALLATARLDELHAKRAMIAIVASVTAAVALFIGFGDPPWRGDLMHSLALVPMAALVWTAVDGRSRLSGLLFGNAASVRIGRISYGVYLYHALAWVVVAKVAARAGFDLWSRGPVTFLFVTAVTCVMAEISWRFIERPLMRRERRPDLPPARTAIEANAAEPQS